jgi:hypothetical protein
MLHACWCSLWETTLSEARVENAGAAHPGRLKASHWENPVRSWEIVTFDEGVDAASVLAAHCHKEQMAGVGVSSDGKLLYLAARDDTAEVVQKQVLRLDVDFPGGDPTFLKVPEEEDVSAAYVLRLLLKYAQRTEAPAVALRGHEVFFALPTDASEQECFDRDSRLKKAPREADPWSVNAEDGFHGRTHGWATLSGDQTPAHVAPLIGDQTLPWGTPPLNPTHDPDYDWVGTLESRGLIQPLTDLSSAPGDSSDSGDVGDHGGLYADHGDLNDSGGLGVRTEGQEPHRRRGRRGIIAGVAATAAAAAVGSTLLLTGGHGSPAATSAAAQSSPTSVTVVLSSDSLAPRVSAQGMPADVYNTLVKGENTCAATNNAHAAKGVVAQAQTALNQFNCNSGAVQAAISVDKQQPPSAEVTQSLVTLGADENAVQGQISAANQALNTRNSAGAASNYVGLIEKYWHNVNSWLIYSMNHPSDSKAKKTANTYFGDLYGWVCQINSLASKAGISPPFGAKALGGSVGAIVANAKTAKADLQTVLAQNQSSLQNVLHAPSPVTG